MFVRPTLLMTLHWRTTIFMLFSSRFFLSCYALPPYTPRRLFTLSTPTEYRIEFLILASAWPTTTLDTPPDTTMEEASWNSYRDFWMFVTFKLPCILLLNKNITKIIFFIHWNLDSADDVRYDNGAEKSEWSLAYPTFLKIKLLRT